MSVQARSFGASLALHGGVLLGVLSLCGQAPGPRECPRVIDLRLLESQVAGAALSPVSTAVAALRSREVRAPAPAAASLPQPPAPEHPAPHPEPAPAEVARPAPPEPVPAPAPPATPDPAPARQVSMDDDIDAAPAAAAAGTALVARSDRGGDAVGGREAGSAVSSPAAGAYAGPTAGPPAGAASVVTARGEAASAPSEGTPGGGGSGVRRDLAALREMVQRGLGYPGLARRMGWEGRVTLSFVVCPDGRAREVAVVESSGRELLDQCAVDSVRKLTGLPASTAEAKVIVPLVYRLH